ncbi:MAG TPA: hypothetical protein VH109_03790 [Steroidobacteraceae bacterium]|jgi:hypothetical protein|nr:hypothetical protein [Steroidobacteraceae bacterium]
MVTNDLISAAAVIAAPLAVQSFNSGGLPPEKIREIAHLAMEMVKEIEREARQAYNK